MAVLPEDAQRLPADPVDVGDVLGADKVLERRSGFAQRAEHEPADHMHAQAPEPVLLLLEGLGHAALAAHAALEGRAQHLAGKVVAPVVVDAHELVDLAGRHEHEGRPLVRAAIDHRADLAVAVAHQDDGRGADLHRDEAARLRDLRLEPEEMPDRPAEDRLLFLLEDRRVRVDDVRNAADAFGGPNDGSRVGRGM